MCSLFNNLTVVEHNDFVRISHGTQPMRDNDRCSVFKNCTEILLNPDLILYIEKIPDTVVTLTNGDKIYLRESASELQQRFIAYKREIFAATLHGGLPSKNG